MLKFKLELIFIMVYLGIFCEHYTNIFVLTFKVRNIPLLLRNYTLMQLTVI